MDEKERKLRVDLSTHPFQCNFGGGWDYLLQRLWCSLADEGRRVQAGTHASMIKDRLNALRDDFKSRGFDDYAESSNIRIALRGLDELARIIDTGDASDDLQDTFALIYHGLMHHLKNVTTETYDLDDRLREPN